ncbi:hypothetical protein R6Q59_035606 [Mikania micrantha]
MAKVNVNTSRLPQSTINTATATTPRTPRPIPVSTSPRTPRPIPSTTPRTPQPFQSTTPTCTYQPTTNDPDLRPFFSRLTTTLRHSFSQRRPWFELVDRSTFCRPETLSETTSRIKKNLSYFHVNYIVIIGIVTVLSLLSHPFPLFFLVSLLAAWIYLYLFRPPDQPAFVFDRTFPDRDILGILIISSILIVFLTGLGSLLISSIVFGFGITCVHAAFRVPQEVFVEDQDPMNTGYLSFLMGTTAFASVPRV